MTGRKWWWMSLRVKQQEESIACSASVIGLQRERLPCNAYTQIRRQIGAIGISNHYIYCIGARRAKAAFGTSIEVVFPTSVPAPSVAIT